MQTAQSSNGLLENKGLGLDSSQTTESPLSAALKQKRNNMTKTKIPMSDEEQLTGDQK